MKTVENLATELAKEVAKTTEISIMAQLNEFISRGLIEVEVGAHTLMRSYDSDKIEYRSTVTLRLKDREYIERLEKENAAFRKCLEQMKEVK